jgi:hypothetical protein
MALFDRKFTDLGKAMLKFLAAGAVYTFLAVFLSFAGLVAVYSVALVSASGKWALGSTFDQWFQSMGATLLPDGTYSATDPSTCWVCDLFSRLLDMMGGLALKVFVLVSSTVWTLTVVAFALWLLMYVYRKILIEHDGSVDELFREVVKKVIVISMIGVAINIADATVLRNSAKMIFDNTAVPIIKMGVGTGGRIIETPICQKLSYPPAYGDGMFTQDVKDDLLCFMNSVSIAFSSAITAGANMVHFSVGALPNPAAFLDMLGGVAMVVIFFLLLLKIPLVMIDIIFTLGVLMGMTPVMLAGYAYEDTKGFSNTGFKALWGIAFYMIMYCVFLGIIYSSFVYIGDMYYPGPLDGFTYLFPDFIYDDMVGSRSADIRASAYFRQCFDAAAGDVNRLRNCLAGKNIAFEMPSLERPLGSFMPLLGVGIMSLMIMGNLKDYAGIVSGYMLTISDNIKQLGKSAFAMVTSVGRKAVGSLGEKMKGPGIKDAMEGGGELKREAEKLLRDSKRAGEP